MNLDFIDMLEGYKAENDELLQNMEDSLMQIREDGMNDDNINAVFRAAHTIKGSSGMFGIDYIVAFTHIAENLLDKIRNHKIEINDEMIELLLACKDQMQVLLDFVANSPEGEPDEDISSDSQILIGELQEYLDEGEVQVEEYSENSDDDNSDENHSNESCNQSKAYKIEIDFLTDTFNNDFEHLNLINYLNEIGEIQDIHTNIDSIPLINDIELDKCYISYVIDIVSNQDVKTMGESFDLIKESSNIKIISEDELINNINEEEVSKEKIQPTTNNSEKLQKNQTTTSEVKKSNFIRIEASKVDNLINLIGEMVISNATVMQYSVNLQNSELIESVSSGSRMLEEIREIAMQIRMVPIGDTFNKFKRIVHDTANKIGKEVTFKITGGDTELDKTVIEKIADPLVHLIRNSVDHGIELPDARESIGKNKDGLLELNAYHDAGSIAIEIIDDGNGLDAEVLFAKGVEKGLIDEDAELSEKEIFELILQPGFSTAKEVSDISGRGVGMDVVKRNISELRGHIEIQSEKSKGTKIIIKLPLTLAIIDGFLTKVGDTSMIVPLDMVVECIELSRNIVEQMHDNNYINLRGSILPILNIGTFFSMDIKENARNNIVVVRYGDKKMGILVDELLGELQTVIKPMSVIFKNLHTFSGSTILGSGEIALIIDIPVLIEMMEVDYAQAS